MQVGNILYRLPTPSTKMDRNTTDMWFQHDGALCHTAYVILDIQHKRFDDIVISCSDYVNWPTKSCNLIPLTKCKLFTANCKILAHAACNIFIQVHASKPHIILITDCVMDDENGSENQRHVVSTWRPLATHSLYAAFLKSWM